MAALIAPAIRHLRSSHLMIVFPSSDVMPRTTVDIADPILAELKAIQRQDGRPLGQIVSQLLAEALSRRAASRKREAFRWVSKPMRALVDLADKEALHAALDRRDP